MGIIKSSPKAHPFVAIMFNSAGQRTACLEKLKTHLGNVLARGPVFRVTDFTDYYVREFGNRLQKQFFVFNKPVDLEDFHKIKIRTNELELADSHTKTRRILNIDPGYLGPSKLVLYSTKNFSHRIYCGKGIFAEITMPYARNTFVRLPWTYDDYFWEENRIYLSKMRTEIVRISRLSV